MDRSSEIFVREHEPEFGTFRYKLQMAVQAYANAMTYLLRMGQCAGMCFDCDDEDTQYYTGETKREAALGILAIFEMGLSGKEHDILALVQANIDPNAEDVMAEMVIGTAWTYYEMGVVFDLTDFAIHFHKRVPGRLKARELEDRIFIYDGTDRNGMTWVLAVRRDRKQGFWPYSV